MENLKHTLKGFAMGVAIFMLVALVCGVLLNTFGGINGLFYTTSDASNNGNISNENDTSFGSTVVLYRHDIHLKNQDNPMDIFFSFYNNDPTDYTSLGVFNEDDCAYEELADIKPLLLAMPEEAFVSATGSLDSSGMADGNMVNVFGLKKEVDSMTSSLLAYFNFPEGEYNSDYESLYLVLNDSFTNISVGEVYDTVTAIPLSAMPDVDWLVEDEVAIPAA